MPSVRTKMMERPSKLRRSAEYGAGSARPPLSTPRISPPSTAAEMTRIATDTRNAIPQLDAWMVQSADALLAGFAERLSDGFDRPLVALALDFWTWQRLDREGLDDEAAAALMTAAVAGP